MGYLSGKLIPGRGIGGQELMVSKRAGRIRWTF
jgi:hypothetical protein